MSQTPKILILEDENLSQEILADGLEEFYDYDVQRAADIESAEEVLASFLPDLFLLDVVLGDDQFRVLHWIKELRERERYRDVPILFVTAYANEMSRHLREIPRADLLPKPFVFEQVVHKIRDLLKG